MPGILAHAGPGRAAPTEPRPAVLAASRPWRGLEVAENDLRELDRLGRDPVVDHGEYLELDLRVALDGVDRGARPHKGGIAEPRHVAHLEDVTQVLGEVGAQRRGLARRGRPERREATGELEVELPRRIEVGPPARADDRQRDVVRPDAGVPAPRAAGLVRLVLDRARAGNGG